MNRPISHWLARLSHTDEQIRHEARLTIGSLHQRDADAVPELSLALESSDADVRFWAAIGLGSIGPAAVDAVPQLVGLLSDAVLRNRQAAASALGRVGHDSLQTITSLARLLKTGDSSAVRREVIQTLGIVGSKHPVALQAILSAVEDPDSVVQNSAENALVAIGINQPDAIRQLLQSRLQIESDAEFRRTLGSVLHRISRSEPSNPDNESLPH